MARPKTVPVERALARSIRAADWLEDADQGAIDLLRVLGRSIDQSVRAGKETRDHFQNMTRLIAGCRELGLTPFGRTVPQPARCSSGKTSP
jgi:hypothetical protein